ncbi:hypothetical protein STRDD11_02763 [Streptococcus sp. DD11]|nr:hypothetical protein STRDD11_02763 [Streptococcus sp. DD11]
MKLMSSLRFSGRTRIYQNIAKTTVRSFFFAQNPSKLDRIWESVFKNASEKTRSPV